MSEPTAKAKEFMEANKKSKVVSGYANYEGGGGCYTLKNGRHFDLSLEDVRSMPHGPDWGFGPIKGPTGK